MSVTQDTLSERKGTGAILFTPLYLLKEYLPSDSILVPQRCILVPKMRQFFLPCNESEWGSNVVLDVMKNVGQIWNIKVRNLSI